MYLIAEKVVCYWGEWSSALPASSIDTSICTHIIYSFIGVDSSGAITGVNTQTVDDAKLKVFISLKAKNPKIKLMVAVGGASFPTTTFSELSKFATARVNFAKNSVVFLQKYQFDGLDLDWEFPANDKANFVLLLTALKSQLSANNLIFSIAVGAGAWISNQAYDIPKMHAQTDFINLMTYDLHGSWDGKTGHNAPMYNDAVSVDSCVKYWIANGAPREKLILGIAAYGQLFTLSNANNHGFDAPTIGATQLPYSEICKNNWQRVWSATQQVPYKFSGNQWVGYDDVESVAVKARYSNTENLGGVMIWSMENDDFTGSCGQGPSPLIKTAYDITILGNTIPSVPVVTTPSTVVTKPASVITKPGPVITKPAPVFTTPRPGATTPKVTKQDISTPPSVTKPDTSKPFTCPSPNGLYADPTSCIKYYSCGNGFAYSMLCNPGMKWNNPNQWCDYPENVQC
ncbi:unnamed protein product [Diamesa serratosioi]